MSHPVIQNSELLYYDPDAYISLVVSITMTRHNHKDSFLLAAVVKSYKLVTEGGFLSWISNNIISTFYQCIFKSLLNNRKHYRVTKFGYHILIVFRESSKQSFLCLDSNGGGKGLDKLTKMRKLWYFSWVSSSSVKQSFRWNWFQIGSCYILFDESNKWIHPFFLRTCTLTKCTIAIRTTLTVRVSQNYK